MKTQKLLLTIALAGATTVMATDAMAKKGDRSTGRNAPMGMTPTIYVTGQDLVYDTILLTEVPYNGTDNFQALEFDGPTGVQTEFGPGDIGYYGGRWWVDMNPNGYMDEDDFYFVCPLLGPGRELEE